MRNAVTCMNKLRFKEVNMSRCPRSQGTAVHMSVSCNCAAACRPDTEDLTHVETAPPTHTPLASPPTPAAQPRTIQTFDGCVVQCRKGKLAFSLKMINQPWPLVLSG